MHISTNLSLTNATWIFQNKNIYIISRDGTKQISSTRSIGYRVNFKVSVKSAKNPIPISRTFRYFSDTLHPIIMMSGNEIQTEHNTLDLMSLC